MTPDTPQGFSDLVGLEFTDVEPGYSRGVVEVTDELTNPYGSLHGSVFHVMADTGMGAALSPDLEAEQRCATIEIKVSYLDPVRSGRVVCETSLLTKGRSVAHLESTLEHDGETVARATGTYSVLTS